MSPAKKKRPARGGAKKNRDAKPASDETVGERSPDATPEKDLPADEDTGAAAGVAGAVGATAEQGDADDEQALADAADAAASEALAEDADATEADTMESDAVESDAAEADDGADHDADEADADAGDDAVEGPPGRTPTERLHKFLASTGAGSRRECETFIATGRVTVNGKVVTKMGVKVDPVRDEVRLDGEPVKREQRVYYLLHKPSGYICTNSDERGRPRAIDLIQDKRHRIYTVGRLDAESTGLILCTNDGAISNVVCHPRYRIEKVYQVAVRGDVSREEVAKVEAGVWLAEGRSSPAKVKPVGKNPRRNETILEMTIFEGRNREIRRVFAKIGLMVRRLTRVRIGPLEMGEIPPGAWRPLAESDLEFVHDAERLYLANREAWDAERLRRIARRSERPAGGRIPWDAGRARAGRAGRSAAATVASATARPRAAAAGAAGVGSTARTATVRSAAAGTARSEATVRSPIVPSGTGRAAATVPVATAPAAIVRSAGRMATGRTAVAATGRSPRVAPTGTGRGEGVEAGAEAVATAAAARGVPMAAGVAEAEAAGVAAGGADRAGRGVRAGSRAPAGGVPTGRAAAAVPTEVAVVGVVAEEAVPAVGAVRDPSDPRGPDPRLRVPLMAPKEANVLKQISAAVVALHAWLESLHRAGERKSSPEMISAARAVRDMQDAIALLQADEPRR